MESVKFRGDSETDGLSATLRTRALKSGVGVLPWTCDLFGAVQTRFNPTREKSSCTALSS